MEKDKKTEVPERWRVRSNTGMAGVIPAWKLSELLDISGLKIQREIMEEKLSKEKKNNP